MIKAIEFILFFLGFNRNFYKNSSYEKKIIRNLLKSVNLNKSRFNKQVYILKLDYNNINNIRLDLKGLNESNFKLVTLQDLLHLKHNKFYEKNYSFKMIKDIKFIGYTYYDYDKTSVYLAFFSLKDYRLFDLHFNKIISFKYKSCFTTQERKLLYKLKNNLYKGKYSYNFDYMLDINYNIETLKKELETLERQYNLNNLSYIERNKTLNDLIYFKRFNYCTIETLKAIEYLKKDIDLLVNESFKLLETLESKKQELETLETLKDNLTFSANEKNTTLNDYYY